MRWIIGWIPFIINLFLLKVHIAFVFTIPFSLILGMIILAIYSDIKMKECKKGSDEWYKHKTDRDLSILGAISGTYKCFSETKKGVKDVLDVDHWDKI